MASSHKTRQTNLHVVQENYYPGIDAAAFSIIKVIITHTLQHHHLPTDSPCVVMGGKYKALPVTNGSSQLPRGWVTASVKVA